ncbi:MAG: PilZ domain-containing protein [Candidatus Omnitrophica bacterium]|nr:PilZ domain-containing protein [Candidatus Omnitrophota bacterium]
MSRRKFLRAEYPCLITLRKHTPSPFTILTHTENIGVGGVRVIVAKRIEPMTEMDLEIDLMDTLPTIVSKGTVKWVKKVPPAQEGQPSRGGSDVKILKGTIAWVKEIPPTRKGQPLRYDTGIQFIVLKGDDGRRIQNIVKRIERTVKKGRE